MICWLVVITSFTPLANQSLSCKPVPSHPLFWQFLQCSSWITWFSFLHDLWERFSHIRCGFSCPQARISAGLRCFTSVLLLLSPVSSHYPRHTPVHNCCIQWCILLPFVLSCLLHVMQNSRTVCSGFMEVLISRENHYRTKLQNINSVTGSQYKLCEILWVHIEGKAEPRKELCGHISKGKAEQKEGVYIIEGWRVQFRMQHLVTGVCWGIKRSYR